MCIFTIRMRPRIVNKKTESLKRRMAFMRQPNLCNVIKTFFFSHLFAMVPPGLGGDNGSGERSGLNKGKEKMNSQKCHFLFVLWLTNICGRIICST